MLNCGHRHISSVEWTNWFIQAGKPQFASSQCHAECCRKLGISKNAFKTGTSAVNTWFEEGKAEVCSYLLEAFEANEDVLFSNLLLRLEMKWGISLRTGNEDLIHRVELPLFSKAQEVREPANSTQLQWLVFGRTRVLSSSIFCALRCSRNLEEPLRGRDPKKESASDPHSPWQRTTTDTFDNKVKQSANCTGQYTVPDCTVDHWSNGLSSGTIWSQTSWKQLWAEQCTHDLFQGGFECRIQHSWASALLWWILCWVTLTCTILMTYLSLLIKKVCPLLHCLWCWPPIFWMLAYFTSSCRLCKSHLALSRV